MRLVEFQRHLFNCDIKHAYRKDGFCHDVYVNKRNKREVTIPISTDGINEIEEIDDSFIIICCLHLMIDFPDQLIPYYESLGLRPSP